MKSKFSLFAVVLLLILVAAFTVVSASPQSPPITDLRGAECYVAITRDQAFRSSQELTHYLTALQSEEVTDATAGHVVAVAELSQELYDASTLSCIPLRKLSR